MTARDYITRNVAGQRALIELPTIPDDAPPLVREGIARRRITMTTGTCPCGARLTGPNRAQRRQMKRDRRTGTGLWSVTVAHANDCPAIDDLLVPALWRWQR